MRHLTPDEQDLLETCGYRPEDPLMGAVFTVQLSEAVPTLLQTISDLREQVFTLEREAEEHDCFPEIETPPWPEGQPMQVKFVMVPPPAPMPLEWEE